MIGLALSGGGSRAMAFHLGCLRALNELSLLDRIGVVSTISGGSVIGAYYAFTPEKSFDEFETDIRSFLRSGFHRDIAIEYLKPFNFVPCVASFVMANVCRFASRIIGRSLELPRAKTRTDVFETVLSRRLFPGLTMTSPRRNGMQVVIGACELRTGTAFRFSHERCGDWRHGTLEESDISVSLAVTASAAYPMFLPCLDRTWWFTKGDLRSKHRVTLTDGGVYDNLGTQVLEPGRDPQVSLLSLPCEYLIVCNAGPGQDSGEHLPTGLFRRTKRSFEVVHRRVQDSAMNRLHQLASAKQIKGFAMPYLGQIDARLPHTPEPFVNRESVVNYPTNFAAMSDDWIEKLSSRGYQQTKILVPHYLPELVNEG